MVREFSFDDLNQVNELIKEFNYVLNRESFNNDFLNILVYVSKSIDGVLVYRNLIDRLEIDYIVTRRSERNKGIATKLLKDMEDKYKNISNITLEVRRSNKEAINFYEKNGFKEVTIRKNYYKDEDGILMIKEYR